MEADRRHHRLRRPYARDDIHCVGRVEGVVDGVEGEAEWRRGEEVGATPCGKPDGEASQFVLQAHNLHPARRPHEPRDAVPLAGPPPPGTDVWLCGILEVDVDDVQRRRTS